MFLVLLSTKIVNLPGGTSKNILEKLDHIIKEKPDDFIVHVGTNQGRRELFNIEWAKSKEGTLI